MGNSNEELGVSVMTGYGFFVQCFVSCKAQVLSPALLQQ